jgi:hypothetical protein
MRYTVVYEDEAYDDIADIVAYLQQYYPSTPERFLAALEERVHAILKFFMKQFIFIAKIFETI